MNIKRKTDIYNKNNKMKKSELKEIIRTSLLEDMEDGVEEMLGGPFGGVLDSGAKMGHSKSSPLESLESMLKSHDWYYAKSDDSRVYRKGNSEERMIKMEMQKIADAGMKEEAMELYKKYAPEGYTVTLREEDKDKEPRDGVKSAAAKLGMKPSHIKEDEVEIEDEVEVTVDDEKEGIEVKQDAESDLTGVVGKIQDNLEAALESARELGDEKLENQIGNTLTFFTRAHVVKEDAQIDVNVDSPAEDAEVGMKLDESVTRMQKLAGLIK